MVFKKQVQWFLKIYRAIWHKIRRLLCSVKIQSMGGMTLYRILMLYLSGLVNGKIIVRAESTAYSFFMSLFPSVVFIFTVIPYIPIEGFQEKLMDMVMVVLPPNTYDMIGTTLDDIISIKRGGLMSVSFLFAIFFATNGISSLISNFKSTYNGFKMRNYISQYWVSMNLLFLTLLIVITTLTWIIFSEISLKHIAQSYNFLGVYVPLLISIGQYLTSAIAALLVVSLVFHFGPKQKSLPFFSPGAVMSTLLIFASSYAFAYYINTFAQYNRLYGSIGAILIFMFWLFINSLLLLIGFELNSAIVRSKRHKKLYRSLGQKDEDTSCTL